MGGDIDLPMGVELTTLSKIPHPKGDIFHVLKSSDSSFSSFGEAYFTSINHGETKGWKKHRIMTLNLVVPVGTVLFKIYDENAGNMVNVVLGEEFYKRLTVPPELWTAFQGLGASLNLILNIASTVHDPGESENLPLDAFE